MPTDHPDTAPSDLAPAARGTAIRSAEVLVTSPDRNFVTLRITTDDGVVGLGDATLNGRELAVASLPARPRRAAADRPGRAPHRGHLAVPLPRRVLAARPGDDGRDRRRRHGAVGHQGARSPGMPLYQLLGGASRDRAHGLRARVRAATCPSCSTRSASTWSRASARSACRPACPGSTPIYGVAAQPSSAGSGTTTSPRSAAPLPGRGGLGHPRLPAPPADRVRGGAQRVRPRAAAAARRAPPDDPDPGGEAGQVPRAVRPVLARGLHARRRTRRRCGWSASTPRRRSRSARSSTPSGTSRR